MSILMGLLSAICWGSTDFLAGSAARKIGVSKSLFFSQIFGLLLLSAIALYSYEPFSFSVENLSICIAASVCNLLAMVFLLKALAIGKAAIVAPIASLYGAITTILSLLSGNSLTSLTIFSLGLCVVGACLTSIPKSSDGKRESSASVIFAFLSSIMFGAGFWLQGEFAVHAFGVINALWVYYCTAVVILSSYLLVKKEFSAPPISILSLIFAISFFSLVGFFSLAYGAKLGHVAIVTVLSSLASGVTALLGFFILGERLSKLQTSGLMVIIAGVMLLKL
ncbi:DMT family transporter [Rahnella sp. CG8]|uniref:DMT family transporter n=1 Tax=Rahnella sp. CG8 TaxID=2726078 RepID=UPI002033901F|nr:DMT family transporter [Rahnella sp. CG8]MCM2448252.1 DMT family transporter [Rahnella sp. CG8]